jgi:hypothetical protein
VATPVWARLRWTRPPGLLGPLEWQSRSQGGVGPASVGAGKGDYKIAAKEYEKLELLDYSMDEEGGNTAG